MVFNMKIEMNTQNKTFEDGFEEFLRHCAVRDYAESTIINYKLTIAQFNKFFSAHMPINEITKDTVKEYVYYLRQTPICPMSACL